MSENADPIDQLLARGLSARDLIAYMLPGIVWLAEHQHETFKLCYHDAADKLIVESVPGPALIARAKELGWTPEDPDPSNPQYMFGEAVYHCRRGVHWYATACDDSTQMLPLAFPESALRAAKKRDERLFGEAAEARRKKARERNRKKALAAQEREANAELSAAVQLAAADFMDAAAKSGKPITVATARRKAWKHIRRCDDWTYHLLLKKLRAMQNNGVQVKA
ncbi:hypothetical protein QEG23_000237 [Stenotrophomonas maltophilia]|uniref:Uncharacterized protein n=1 Tax=Stenotrophomonas maltophilia TaxID=40324 RepID=A0AAI9BW99_STEMA|nr:hypothetical protein [Stenotrophomonas maltophilia]